jgi:hypothetical protein
MAVAAGDTVWVVIAHIGPGEIIGGYTTLALAQAAVGSKQGCSYRILPVVVDTEGGILPQGPGIPTHLTTAIPVRSGIKDGRPHR